MGPAKIKKKTASPAPLEVVPAETPAPNRAQSLFPSAGQMGALMGAFDWAQTPLGPAMNWPQSLKTSISICLASRFPIVLYWGPEYVVLYNDAYSVILGSKHPWALGQTCRNCWAEIWDTIGPMLDGVLETGKATWSDDLLLMLQRFGYAEECYFSFSFSPVQVESGAVGGVFTAVIETTDKVIGERRLRTLRDLAARAVSARSEDDTWRIAAGTLAENPSDVPFAILCAPSGDGIRVAGAAGINSSHPLCAALCRPGSELFQNAMQVVKSGQRATLENFVSLVPDLPHGAWDTAPVAGLLLPLAALGQGPSGVLLVAASPAKRLDDSYRTFFDLVARQIATSIADARAYEEERRRAEALAQLDRAKTRFFSNVSHEFRTPLTLMLGPIEDLLAKGSDGLGAEEHQQLETARRNALRLLKLVNTLLDFSRIEAGRERAVYEPTDLATLTAEIAGLFRSAMEKAGLRFSVICEPVTSSIYVDREMWEKIVLNLLSNAFKFTFSGEVELTLKQTGGGVQLAVRDTGTGIPEAELPRVFERFHRIENASARTYEGTGIGLALVQELVKFHGGSVQVESTAGRGSRFTVTIPQGTAHLPPDRIQLKRTLPSTTLPIDTYLYEHEKWLLSDSDRATDNSILPRQGNVAAPDLAQTSQRELIVIADDNADMRDYLARLLRDSYSVHTVADGVQAVSAARRLRPALVLADVMMPGLDGFQVLQAVRSDESLKSTPVILLSARAGEESRVEGLQAGADDYLVKPFTARELIARVATNIRMATLRRQAADREAWLRAEAELERHRLQEKASQESEYRLRVVTEATPIMIWMAGTDKLCYYFNKSWLDFVGRKLEQEMGNGWAENVHPDDVDRCRQTYLTCFDARQPFEMEYRLRHHSGQYRWILDHGVPRYGPDGTFEGYVGGCLDIHDQKESAEKLRITSEALRESEERLRLAQQVAAIGTFELDLRTNVNRWTPELEAIYGLSPGTFEGTQEHWQRLLYPGDRADVLRQVEMCLGSCAPVQAEWRVIWPDGSIHWVLGRWRVFKDESGTPARLVGINIDVTDRKAAEEAQRRLAAIVESSDDAIVSKDLNGIVISWNKQAERMFGYTEAEMVGRPITTIIPPEFHSDEDMILGKIRRGERIDHFETIRVAKSGERIEVSLSISPVKDGHDRIIGAAKIARDITQNKKIERALRTTEKLAAAGRLAATVAHEINNPLEAVNNLVFLARRDLDNLLRRDLHTAEKIAGYLQSAERELDRVAHIARQTLGFYRDTSAPARLDVAKTLDDLLYLYERRLESRKIRVIKQYGPEMHVTALAGEIRQALSNLISNAIDAMPAGGSLVVRVSKSRERHPPFAAGIRITILDTGSGIQPNDKKNLFEPFFTTKTDVGTGLGLWITKNIIEKHQGVIRVKSKTGMEEHGTAVSIFLPEVKKNDAHAAADCEAVA